MSRADYFQILKSEVRRLDDLSVSKRSEKVISGFTSDVPPQAIIGSKSYSVFNSNDYLGLRHHPKLKQAESRASEKFGVGPGAVRFISGSLQIHRDLEMALAQFHGRDDAMIFSSAFAANLAVISSLIKGQSKDSLLDANTLVVSDELNHRSIVEGIRVANFPDTQRRVFHHFDLSQLEQIFKESKGKFTRVLVVTDGVFSMLGEYQNLEKLRSLIDAYDSKFPQGVLMFVDDCHGIGVLGDTGRGVEQLCGTKSDVLVGTLGKAFGVDGGYVTASQSVIDYLRESAATYIYSNPISPGAAAAALESVHILDSVEGKKLLENLRENISHFKKLLSQTSIALAADSKHAIQPLLLADAAKAKALQDHLFQQGFLTTSITYPVVPKGRDEIRVQLSAAHTFKDLEKFVQALAKFSS